MTKLKKFTITCGAIFLVCVLGVLVMLPFCVNDLVDSYNEIISDDMEFTYHEITLDENVKNLNIYNSCYVEMRKSKDNLIHVKTLNAGITNFSANVYYYDSDDKAELDFSQKGNGAITKDNIIKTINWNINHIPEAIIYVPENINITTVWQRLRNPYTGEFYPQKPTDHYITNSSEDTVSVEVVTDKASLILEINECKNTLQQLYYELDDRRAEYADRIKSDMIIGTDSFNYLYENILTERLHMVDLIYSLNQNEEMRSKYEEIAYTLTANEQALDISKLKIENAKKNSDHETFTKIRIEENAKIEVSQKIVSDLSLKFDNYIKLSSNFQEAESSKETDASSSNEQTMPTDEESTSSQSSKQSMESESSKTEDNSSSEK